jgi:TPP-dependent pyruvate/acetoin dehydrogenase alpha subunit
LTYRVGPHSSSDDPSLYRDEGAARAWIDRDPIALLRSRLLARGELDAASDAELTRALLRELDEAVELAAAAPPPAVATLCEDVYASPPWHLAEQAAALARGARAPA